MAIYSLTVNISQLIKLLQYTSLKFKFYIPHLFILKDEIIVIRLFGEKSI